MGAETAVDARAIDRPCRAAIHSRMSAENLSSAGRRHSLAHELGGAIGPALGGAAMDLWDPHGLPLAVAGTLAGFLLFAASRRLRGARRLN